MIMNTKNMKIMIIAALTALILSACGAAAPAEPTQDPNAVFTQVAETVMVSMTQTFEAMPPTPMPEPTATLAPTLPPVPTGDPLATQEVVPTMPVGPTSTVQKFGDSASWLSSNPADGSTFSPSEEFNLTICMRNNGSTIWDNTYYLQWVDGYRLWSDTSNFFIDKGASIEPGEKWCFTLPSVAPATPGSYTSYWNMYNKEKQYMAQVYFPFGVQ